MRAATGVAAILLSRDCVGVRIDGARRGRRCSSAVSAVRKERKSRRVTTIVLADEQTAVRQGIRCLLEMESDLKVAGEAADGLEVVPLVERLRPDVLVLGVQIPGLNGLDVTLQVRQRVTGCAVILFTRLTDEWYAAAGLRNGAAGYVLKQADARELVKAIRAVTRGRRYVSTEFPGELVQSWTRQGPGPAEDSYDRLTNREREVFQLAAEGHSSRAIGQRLAISARTAETHRANVMQKLRLKNQTGLVRYALARGILPPIAPMPSGPAAVRR
jgi:two-component system, NarL family, response regulator NreC